MKSKLEGKDAARSSLTGRWITRSDKWPITITLLAGAIAVTIPILLLAGVLYLTSSYFAILKDVADIDSQSEPTETR